jgi:hypothetical protein
MFIYHNEMFNLELSFFEYIKPEVYVSKRSWSNVYITIKNKKNMWKKKSI